MHIRSESFSASGFITAKWVRDMGTTSFFHWGALLVTCRRSQKTVITWNVKLKEKKIALFLISLNWTTCFPGGKSVLEKRLTAKFYVNLNIPLLLWAAGCRHRPVPSALVWSVPAARKTLLEMMDGPARVPSCCRMALVGQGVSEHSLVLPEGSPDWDLVVAPVPRVGCDHNSDSCSWTLGALPDAGHAVAWRALSFPDLLWISSLSTECQGRSHSVNSGPGTHPWRD